MDGWGGAAGVAGVAAAEPHAEGESAWEVKVRSRGLQDGDHGWHEKRGQAREGQGMEEQLCM